MFPISHSDEILDVGNLDGTDVPLRQDGDETETGNQVLDTCSSKKHASVTSQLSHKSAGKTETAVDKSAAQRQSSARYRYTGRNRSSFPAEKRRERQWGSERSRKVDGRREKVPSNAVDREHAPSREMADELINSDAAAAEPLMETVSRDCSGRNRTEVLTETMDSVDHDADFSKPVMPSRHKQKSYSGNYTVYGRDRFSSASYSKYSDDYDDYVVQPKHYRGQKSNRRPKLTKKDADFNAARNDVDDNSNRNHAMYMSASSTKNNNDDYVSQLKHYGGLKSNRQLKAEKIHAVAVSNDAKKDLDKDSNHDHAAGSSAVSSKCSDDHVSQPKSVKTANNEVSDDTRNDFDETGEDSHLSRTVCNQAVLTKPDSAVASDSKQKKTQFSGVSRQRQRDGYRRYQNKKDCPTDSTLDDSQTLQTKAANTQQCQNNKSDIRNSTEMKVRSKNYWPRGHRDRKGPDKARRSSVSSDEQLQKTTAALSHFSVEGCKDDDKQLEHGAAGVQKDCPINSTLEDSSTLPARAVITEQRHSNNSDTCNRTETASRRKNYWPRKRWGRKGPDKARSSVSSDEQLQKTTDALSHLSVEVQRDNGSQLECESTEVLNDSGSSEQKHMKQSSLCQTGTASGSHELRSQRRRNNRTRKDYNLLTKQQRGPDGSSRAQMEQRNGRSHYNAGRNVHQGSNLDDYQNSNDNQSNRVDKPAEPPSASHCDNRRPPGFHVYYRRASATTQLPTS